MNVGTLQKSHGHYACSQRNEFMTQTVAVLNSSSSFFFFRRGHRIYISIDPPASQNHTTRVWAPRLRPTLQRLGERRHSETDGHHTQGDSVCMSLGCCIWHHRRPIFEAQVISCTSLVCNQGRQIFWLQCYRPAFFVDINQHPPFVHGPCTHLFDTWLYS